MHPSGDNFFPSSSTVSNNFDIDLLLAKRPMSNCAKSFIPTNREKIVKK